MTSRPVHRLAACILVAVAGAALAADDTPMSPGRPLAQDLKFEGLWARPGSVTLIKQFHNFLALHGKDEASAWSARCVLGAARATCRGTGTTTTGFEFAYESVVTLDGGNLRENWRALFPGEQELRGDDVLRPIPLPAAVLPVKPPR
jgi:hypothetical protein